MKIKVPWADMHLTDTSAGMGIIDEDTGKRIGVLVHYGGNIGRHINLFGKYVGNFKTWEECAAFAKGAEAVLNHLVQTPRKDKAPRFHFFARGRRRTPRRSRRW